MAKTEEEKKIAAREAQRRYREKLKADKAEQAKEQHRDAQRRYREKLRDSGLVQFIAWLPADLVVEVQAFIDKRVQDSLASTAKLKCK